MNQRKKNANKICRAVMHSATVTATHVRNPAEKKMDKTLSLQIVHETKKEAHLRNVEL